MNKIWSNSLVLALVLIGLGATGIRYVTLKPGQFPAGDSVWQISIESSFSSKDKQTTLKIPLPVESRGTRIVKQSFLHPKFSIGRVHRDDLSAPFVSAHTKRKGRHKLVFEYTIHVIRQSRKKSKAATRTETADTLQFYLKNELHERINTAWIKQRADALKLKATDKDKYILAAYDYVNRLTKLPRQFYQQKYTGKLRKPNPFDKSLLLASLLRENQIPVRIITGVRLMEMIDGSFHYWIQVYHGDRWSDYDPFYGFKNEVPSNYLAFKYDARPFIEPSGAQEIKTEIDITELQDNIGAFTSGQKSLWDILDLTRLSKDLQDNINKLLLLPFGILLTLFIRQFTGVRCYGTFTPTLLALAFSVGDVRINIVLFLIVALLTYAGRFFMPKKMSRVPRLSIVFTIVALALIIGISLLDHFDLNPSGATLLLPIVILASLLDRFYTTWDDSGKRVALIRLFWTAVLGILCLPIITFTELGRIMMFYPELHLLTMAVVLLVYTQKQLKIFQPIPAVWLGEIRRKSKTEKATTEVPPGTGG
jgi:hypothetical protein